MDYLIQKGNDSVSVLKIQQCLNLIQPDLNLKEDGIFEEKTEQAIMKFQKSTGLEEDGCLSSITWDKIILKVKTLKKTDELTIHTQPALSIGNQGLDVLKAQQYLNRIQPESLIEENGIFDAKTQIKVIRFQNKCGLNPDGRIGILTWTKIIEHV